MPIAGVFAQSKGAPKKSSALLAARGQKLFLTNCAACHGASAKGDDGPNLHGLKLSDKKIASIISKGFAGEMPAFKSKLSPADIKALVAYIQSLKK